MPKKDAYKYYNLTFRHRKEINKVTLNALKKVVFRFFTDITITDIRIRKINKPSEWREE